MREKGHIASRSRCSPCRRARLVADLAAKGAGYGTETPEHFGLCVKREPAGEKNAFRAQCVHTLYNELSAEVAASSRRAQGRRPRKSGVSEGGLGLARPIARIAPLRNRLVAEVTMHTCNPDWLHMHSLHVARNKWHSGCQYGLF